MAKDDYGFMLRSSLSLRVIPKNRPAELQAEAGRAHEDARPLGRR